VQNQSDGNTLVGTSKDGTRTLITNYQTTTTMGDHTITTTTVATTAVYSNKPGEEGTFLSASQSTTTTVEHMGLGSGPDTTTHSGSTAISHDQAVLNIGAEQIAKGIAAEAKGVGSYTVEGMGQTVRDHPVRVLGGAAGVIGGALKANPWAMAGGTAVIWCAAGGPGC
jgi:hypothetical protein